MKKLLALLLAVSLVLGLAACGSKTDTPATTPAKATTAAKTDDVPEATEAELEHMDITLAWWDGESILADHDEIQQYLEDKFNVTFEVMNVTWDDYTQKEQLWASTDSLPDIFAADFRNTSSFATWAREGVIRALPDDLSAYPNLAKYMEGAAADGCKVDGKFYCIFRQTYGEQAETVKDRLIAYRWDLAQEAGITEEPKNWDEFRAMIKAIEAADPQGKKIGGMTAPGADYLVGPMFCYSMPNAIVSGATFKWVEQDGQYVPAYFAGETLGADALPTWNLLRDMYTEGTIDKDIALATLEQSKNQFLSGQSAALCITYSQLINLDEAWEEMNGSAMEDDIRILDLMPSVDGNTYYWAWDYAWSESMFSSNVDDAKMERIMMIYDYLLSDEGVMKCKYGNEGISYEIKDGNLQFIDGQKPLTFYKSVDVFGNLVAWQPVLPNGWTAPNANPDWYNAMLDAYVAQAQKVTLPATEPACITEFLALGTEFSLNLKDDTLLIMTGSKPVEEMWNEIISDYQADGLDEIIAQVNEAMK